jgi:hypothetical protein
MLFDPLLQVDQHLLADPLIANKAGFQTSYIVNEGPVIGDVFGRFWVVMLRHECLFDLEVVLGIFTQAGKYFHQQIRIKFLVEGGVKVIDHIHQIPVVLV